MENKSILTEAESIVNGSRNEQYGDPVLAFKIYSEILMSVFGINLTPIEICKVQIAIKLGRQKFNHKRDNLVDTCGYTEILNRLEDAEKLKIVPDIKIGYNSTEKPESMDDEFRSRYDEKIKLTRLQIINIANKIRLPIDWSYEKKMEAVFDYLTNNKTDIDV